jgi:hypothetical protein
LGKIVLPDRPFVPVEAVDQAGEHRFPRSVLVLVVVLVIELRPLPV